MRIHVITLFPGMFKGPFEESIIGRASDRGLVEVNVVDLREFGVGRHKLTDDTVYGGGAGMLMKPEPIVSAVESLTLNPDKKSDRDAWVVLTSARGRLFNQQIAAELCRHSELIVICGRYEGVDERVSQLVVDDEISIGDYVLTGGEIAAMSIVDATLRLLPGVVGSARSLDDDSHSNDLLEYPQYTRPAALVFTGFEPMSAIHRYSISPSRIIVMPWRPVRPVGDDLSILRSLSNSRKSDLAGCEAMIVPAWVNTTS